LYVYHGLKIQWLTSTAPYIADQSKLSKVPAIQEYEIDLPKSGVSGDMRIRIPDEMMPSEPQALEYFEYYFTNIHPFVPVLCQSEFYRSWNSERDSLPPLILEAIFACTTGMLGHLRESGKWLALASSTSPHILACKRLLIRN
jgi:hypothetical protein